MILHSLNRPASKMERPRFIDDTLAYPIYATIENLRGLLASFYGEDFAFSITVKGKVVAASNLKQGIILTKRPTIATP